MKKLQEHLGNAFPSAKKQAPKASDLGLVIPDTESIETIKTEIKKFFVDSGHSIVEREEETELAFKKGKKFVFVIIANIHDEFRFFVVEMEPE
jgi:hypothetical protein